jgi:hypothetical protein
MLLLLVGSSNEFRRRDGFTCHDMHTKVHTICSSHSVVVMGDTHTDIMVTS